MSIVLKKKGEKSKVYFLAGLCVLAVYLLWSNSGSDQPSLPAPEAARPVAPPVSVQEPASTARVQRRGLSARGEFRPGFSKRPEDRIDPNKVDPALRLDLLTKVQSVTLEGGSRNLFQFGTAAPPAPTTPIPKVRNIPIRNPAVEVSPVNPGPPAVAQAPPIPLRYYGFSNAKGAPRKRAFFLDGEEILVVWEGDTVKSRYKLVHIGVNSVDMEDMQFKSRQTLPLEPELAG